MIYANVFHLPVAVPGKCCRHLEAVRDAPGQDKRTAAAVDRDMWTARSVVGHTLHQHYHRHLHSLLQATMAPVS